MTKDELKIICDKAYNKQLTSFNSESGNKLEEYRASWTEERPNDPLPSDDVFLFIESTDFIRNYVFEVLSDALCKE